MPYADLMGLLVTVDQYREPIEYDLIRLGLRLRDVGTDAFTWADLFVIVRQAPRDSALVRALDEDHEWGLAELLLAEVADGIAVANWHRSGTPTQARKGDFPKPIPRPGHQPDETTYGKGALPIDEMAEWLGWT